MEAFAALPALPETLDRRNALVEQLAQYGVYQTNGAWVDEDGRKLGPVTPEGSMRAEHQNKQAIAVQGLGRTPREIARYLVERRKTASPFDQKAWALLEIFQATRPLETFLGMAIAYWLDAKQELQVYGETVAEEDQWRTGDERDERIRRELLEWLGIDLESCYRVDAHCVYYRFLSTEKSSEACP